MPLAPVTGGDRLFGLARLLLPCVSCAALASGLPASDDGLWDEAGNLTSVDGPSGLTSYLIDPQSLTGQPQTLEEFDGSGALTMSYIVGDRVLAQTPAGAGTAYLLIDGQGSTRQLTDSTGTVTASYSYDAFGNITASSRTATTAYLYTGQRLDGASGTYALGIRLYDPTQGRFDSRASFPGFLDAPLTMNPYAYCGGNPVNYYDPSGNFPIPNIANITVGDVGTFAAGQLDGFAFSKAISVLAPGMQAFTNLALGEQALISARCGAIAYGSAGLSGQISVAAANVGINSSIQIFLGGDLTVTLAINDISDALDGAARPGSRTPKNESPGRPPNAERRTPAENKQARNQFKNNKDAAREAWELRTGQRWPTDANGNPWPAEHTPPLKEGGDPMRVTPRDPATDPHNLPGSDGLTDYQRWGAEGTPARGANRKVGQ